MIQVRENTSKSVPASLLEPLSDALEGLDPLTQFAKEQLDPLTKMAVEMVSHSCSDFYAI